MSKFKVGDRVKDSEGDKATVMAVKENKVSVHWDFDECDYNAENPGFWWKSDEFTLIEAAKQEARMTPLVETVTTKRVVKGKHELSNCSVLVIHEVHNGFINISFAPGCREGWYMDKHAIAELIGVLQEIQDAMPEPKN